MRIVHYAQPNTRSPGSGLENEIGRWFAAFDGLTGGRHFPVDLYEDKDNAYVRAELPGVQKSDINVEAADGLLTITATRKQRSSDNGEGESLSFSRSVAIAELVQLDKVGAAYENGVLTVTLPKREEAKPRKIAVS